MRLSNVAATLFQSPVFAGNHQQQQRKIQNICFVGRVFKITTVRFTSSDLFLARLSDEAANKRLPFDPERAANTDYPPTKFQPYYFVAESFEDAKSKVRYDNLIYINSQSHYQCSISVSLFNKIYFGNS